MKNKLCLAFKETNLDDALRAKWENDRFYEDNSVEYESMLIIMDGYFVIKYEVEVEL